MNWLEKIIAFSNSKKMNSRKTKVKVPNGWGRQNYLGKPQKAEFHEIVDLRNIDRKRGWIQGFMAKRIDGIRKWQDKNKTEYSTTYTPIE